MNKKFDVGNSNSHKSILGISVFLIGLIAVFFVGAQFTNLFTGKVTSGTGRLQLSIPVPNENAHILKCNDEYCSTASLVFRSVPFPFRADLTPGMYLVHLYNQTSPGSATNYYRSDLLLVNESTTSNLYFDSTQEERDPQNYKSRNRKVGLFSKPNGVPVKVYQCTNPDCSESLQIPWIYFRPYNGLTPLIFPRIYLDSTSVTSTVQYSNVNYKFVFSKYGYYDKTIIRSLPPLDTQSFTSIYVELEPKPLPV